MKIEFNVPEWAIGRNIYIFAGRELLGDKKCLISHKDGKHITEYLSLRLKPEDGRCTGCGSCCGSNGIPRSLLIEMKRALHGYRDYDGACAFLKDTGCMLRGSIPFSCAKSVCTDYEGCTEVVE